jgi:hypothetical protein
MMPKNPAEYDTAQICERGHVVTESFHDYPAHGRKFCEQCGTKTITACPQCNNEIRGYLRGVMPTLGDIDPPAFCAECGKPYPWTAAKIHAAKALADEIDELPDKDKLLFKASLDEIAADTPMTEVAVMRVKKVFRNLPKASGEALKRATIQVATDAAKALLTGG